MQIYGKTAKELLMMQSNFSFPIYQREYDWRESNCFKLFDDITEKAKSHKVAHFMGTMCCQRTGTELIIVDGQQRIVSLMLLLMAIRDMTRDEDIQEKLNDEYLYFGREHSKLKLNGYLQAVYDKLLKQDGGLFSLNDLTKEDEETTIYKSYNLFSESLYNLISKSRNISLKDIIEAFNYLEFAVIELEDENPQVVFERLNATGVSLTEVDKIKNYVLMPLKDDYYKNYWLPLEAATGDNLSDFIMAYLIIKSKSDIVADKVKISNNTLYDAFKEYCKDKNMKEVLSELTSFIQYYEETRRREEESLRVIFDVFKENSALVFCMYLIKKEKEVEEPLKDAFSLYLSYIVRGKVCEKSNIKNSHTGYLIRRTDDAKTAEEFLYLLKKALIESDGIYKVPNDKEFKDGLTTNDIYLSLGSAGVKYILTEIDKFEIMGFCNSEEYEGVTVEHIMPQKLTDEWVSYLTYDKYCYAQNLHTIGNLAITRKNSELSNKSFEEKCKIYKNEPYYYTREIARYEQWDSKNIKRRASNLAGIAINIWQDIYKEDVAQGMKVHGIYSPAEIFKGKKPKIVSLLGEQKDVKSWNSMLYYVVSTLYDLDALSLFKFMLEDGNNFISDIAPNSNYKHIEEGVYIKTNQESVRIVKNIQKLLLYFDENSDIEVSSSFWFTI